MKKYFATILILASAALAGDIPQPELVLNKMMQQELAKQSSLGAYSVMCRYSLKNKSRNAEMVVKWTREANGVKRYEIVSESGDGGVRSHVFHKLLENETEASQAAQRERSRINSSNYNFNFVAEEVLDGRAAYVFELEPKSDNKFLTRGRVWIDSSDFAVIQVAGAPARNVSFWTKKVDFVQRYRKEGDLWLAASNHSLTDAKLFGLADLTVEYFDYRLMNR